MPLPFSTKQASPEDRRKNSQAMRSLLGSAFSPPSKLFARNRQGSGDSSVLDVSSWGHADLEQLVPEEQAMKQTPRRRGRRRRRQGSGGRRPNHVLPTTTTNSSTGNGHNHKRIKKRDPSSSSTPRTSTSKKQDRRKTLKRQASSKKLRIPAASSPVKAGTPPPAAFGKTSPTVVKEEQASRWDTGGRQGSDRELQNQTPHLTLDSSWPALDEAPRKLQRRHSIASHSKYWKDENKDQIKKKQEEKDCQERQG